MEVSGQPSIPDNLAKGKESQYIVKSRLSQLQNWFEKISCPCQISKCQPYSPQVCLYQALYQAHLYQILKDSNMYSCFLRCKKVPNLTFKLEYTLNSSKLKYQDICIVMLSTDNVQIPVRRIGSLVLLVSLANLSSN
jgi:hypothetical protein